MTLTDTQGGFLSGDTWAWWQARRARYTLALATAGWVAYAVSAALFYAFGQPLWQSARDALSMTLFLGVLCLLVIGAANVCYLAGPAVEAWVKPSDTERYRRTAFAMGFWGSVALPFVFPLLSFAMLLAQGD